MGLFAAPLALAQQTADLSVTMTVSNPTPVVGTQVSFDVKVSNAGPAAVQRTTVRDLLPAGYTYASHQASRGTYDPTSGRWVNFGVGPSGSVHLTLVATVLRTGYHVNVAQVMASSVADPDSTPGNNVPTEDDYAQVATTPRLRNVAPTITGQAPLSTQEETPLTLTLSDLTVTDPDNVYPDDFTLTVLPGSDYELSGPNTIAPRVDFNGTLTVNVTVNDGTDSSPPAGIVVTVTPVNDAPVVVSLAPVSTRSGRPIAIDTGDLSVADPDNTYPDGFSVTVLPQSGYTVSDSNRISPDPGFVGTLAIRLTVSDGVAQSAPFDGVLTVTSPNLVVIMTDDLDVRSLEDLLNAGLMPNLQAYFIDRGVSFTDHYASDPYCCPSRATFFTGKYAHNHGIVSNQLLYGDFVIERAVGQFDDSRTLPTQLQALGYTTAYFGKYLNGYGADPLLTGLSPAFDPHYVPPGWTSWNALVDLSTYCVYDYTISKNGVPTQYLRPLGQREDSATYQTNKLAELAEAFVVAHRDDAAPFFLNVMTLAPHGERCSDCYGGPPPRGDDSFDMRIRPAPEDDNASVPAFVPTPAFNEDISDKPNWLSSRTPPLTTDDTANIEEQYTFRLRAMLSVDRLLGRIVNALGDHLGDTVLIFTSDNGWLYGEHRRGGKVYAYRESARVPLYIAIPGLAAGARPNLVVNNDIEPTLLDIASPGYVDANADGRSLVALLHDPQPPGWTERQRILVEYGRTIDAPGYELWPTYFALRTATQLYTESFDDTWYDVAPPLIGLELYNRATDPYEMTSTLHYPQSPPDVTLESHLNQLKGCAGANCRQYEDAP
jgi:uncharacterized repeat protein (TIGR01451 family)